jgi:protein-S-isoprenylcysteine O-methyltransferase Ste14
LTAPSERRAILSDWAARIVIGTLFGLLSINLLTDFAQTRRLTGLWMLISELLVLVMTVLRRRTQIVDRSLLTAIVTGLSLTGPSLVRVATNQALVPDFVTGLVSSIGLLIVIAGKFTLGRSFGIVPANRGVVMVGPYTVVRHPIYAGYLLTHLAFACANATLWNALILLVADTALVIRSRREERLLALDRSYQTYCERVAWHLVPGLY